MQQKVLLPDPQKTKNLPKLSEGSFFYVPEYEFKKMNGDMSISVLALIKP